MRKSSTSSDAILPLARLPSGIAGLDDLLRGGFPKGSLTIIEGTPGSGKTILGNQLCHHHVRRGGRAIYVTLLAENHARMLLHMGQLRFFDPAQIPDRLYLVSGFRMLEDEGLDGLQTLLRQEVRRHAASVVVLDGLVAVEESTQTVREYKKFLHQLQALATLTGCTLFLLASTPLPGPSTEHTMVDGVVELQGQLVGERMERSLTVHKMRGVAMNGGRHAMRISDDGIAVFPRFESQLSMTRNGDAVGRLITSGIPTLDSLIGGGIHVGASTLVVGPPGIGKTTLGLQFLAACSAEAPGVMLGLYETVDCLEIKADMLGLPTAQQLSTGHVELLWHPTTEAILDELIQNLVAAVRRVGARRIVIDGLGGLRALMDNPARLGRVLAALTVEFQRLGATTLYLAECATDDARRALPLDELSLHGISAVAQNIVLMRYLDGPQGAYRALAVLKARNSPVDLHMHRFEVGAGGITIEVRPDPTGSGRRSGRGAPRKDPLAKVRRDSTPS